MEASHHSGGSVGVLPRTRRRSVHARRISDRWVELGHDGRIMSGWASMGQTREESEKTMAKLIESEGLPPADD